MKNLRNTGVRTAFFLNCRGVAGNPQTRMAALLNARHPRSEHRLLQLGETTVIKYTRRYGFEFEHWAAGNKPNLKAIKRR